MRQSMWSYKMCRNDGVCLAPEENMYYGTGFPGCWLWVLNYRILNPFVWEKRDGTELAGWTPPSLCANVSIDQGYREANSVTPVPHGTLWVCGSYRWPYLHGNWIWQCTWGQPQYMYLSHIDICITLIYVSLPHWPVNRDTVTCMVPSKKDPLVALLLLQGVAKVIEAHITALALHTAHALNYTHTKP